MAEIINKEHKNVPPDKLREHPANPRQGDVGAIYESIKENGFYGTIVVQKSTGYVLAGNHRLKAAKEVGLDTVPVVYVDVDDERAMRILLADNRTNDLATYDDTALSQLLEHLASTDDGLAGTGYDGDYLDDLLRGLSDDEPKDAEAQVDRAEELKDEWQTETGQIWLIPSADGKRVHRLMCGDSTSEDDVGRLLDGQNMDLCLTDPPYGADIEYNSIDDTQGNLKKLVNGFLPLARKYCEVVAITPGVQNMYLYETPTWVLAWYYGAGTGRTPWGFTSWQPFIVYGKDPKLSKGEGCHPDAFQFMMTKEDIEIRKNLSHVVPKPFSVWLRFMQRFTNKKTRNIYDPFAGSGTTIVAAENERRTCYAMEIDPGYVAVCLERLKGIGLQPELLKHSCA